MKPLMLSSLSVLLLTAAPVSAVEGLRPQIRDTIITSDKNLSDLDRITPFELISSARRGRFQNQGIGSYAAFDADYRRGQITAERLVNVAIAEHLLSAQTLADQRFLSAVARQLRALEVNQGG
ncbi:MAG: hypothetical protein F6K19_35865 [Cyanothece sp. SIO1E1]|nr:hypothetical protein [Cyanothece sp. SIO1E1]